jgi:hypothetical protein
MRTETYQNLTIAALDRLRVQQFGAEPLKLVSMTPETGETQVAEISSAWGGHRTLATTGGGTADAGAWQFQIEAAGDQSYMSKIVALKIGSRRWKVKKVEAPAGNSQVWKIKAEIQ